MDKKSNGESLSLKNRLSEQKKTVHLLRKDLLKDLKIIYTSNAKDYSGGKIPVNASLIELNLLL